MKHPSGRLAIGSGPLFPASIFQKHPFAWGLALNRENRIDHFLSLVSRSDCPTDADSSSNGILRAKESSKSAGFVGNATNPCQTLIPAKVNSGSVCRRARNAPREFERQGHPLNGRYVCAHFDGSVHVGFTLSTRKRQHHAGHTGSKVVWANDRLRIKVV